MEAIPYSSNPGLKIPKRHLPKALLRDLSSFLESESTDREARATELADYYGIPIRDILSELDKLKDK